jgi:hypothetical protein
VNDVSTNTASEKDYYPLGDTLRIYAGWLTAVLFLVYAIGSYQQLRLLPFRIDVFDEWLESALLLRVTFTSFLYLLLSSIHRALGGGVWKGIALTLIGFAGLVAFMANT